MCACCSHPAGPCLSLHLRYECVCSSGPDHRWASWRPFPYMKKKAHEFWKNPSTHCADFKILPTNYNGQSRIQNWAGGLQALWWRCTNVCVPPLTKTLTKGVSHPWPRPSRPVYNQFSAYLWTLSSQYLTLPSSSSLPGLNQTTCWFSHPGYATSWLLYLKPTYRAPFACLMPAHSSYLTLCVIASGWPYVDWIYSSFHVPLSTSRLSLPWPSPHHWAVG